MSGDEREEMEEGEEWGPDSLPPASYVLFNFWFLRVTRKSLGLALRAGAFQFTVLQCVSLTLSTTKAEDLVESLRWFLRPLRAAFVSTTLLDLLLASCTSPARQVRQCPSRISAG